MIELLRSMEPWHWLAFGGVLIIFEIFLPSAVLLWPGIAALCVGLVHFLVPHAPWMFLTTLWALLSCATAAGWHFYKKAHPEDAVHKTTINRRGEQYVGRVFTLGKDIVNGVGEIHVDDTRWKIIADSDIQAGGKVRVISVEGTSLRVVLSE